MRTPVVLVTGQGATEDIADVLADSTGTVVVRHRYDGQVVVRTVATQPDTDWALELANGCVSCTVRNDLLVLLRRLHRRDDVRRIVVHLMPWLEPEPVCWAINNVRVRVGPGYLDGPAARDVSINAVVTCIDTGVLAAQAVGADELDDGRTAAQVVVGQAEFADVLVLSDPNRRRWRCCAGWRRARGSPSARPGRDGSWPPRARSPRGRSGPPARSAAGRPTAA